MASFHSSVDCPWILSCAALTLVLGTAACSSSGDDGGGGGTTATTSSQGAGGSGGAGGSAEGGVGGTGGDGFGGFSAGGFAPTPVRELQNLVSITFYERTGGTEPTPYTFTVDGAELTTRLPDPLTLESHDIPGATSEYYDVYYSDVDGNFVLDGSYLTISGVFEHPLPAGGGLNLAEISLNFEPTAIEFGNWVASFVALGDNQHPETVDNCIDGDLQTHTTMGNTVDASERLRLTLGFASTSGPPPR